MLVTVLLGPEGLKGLSHGCQVNVVNCHAMTRFLVCCGT